MSLTVRAATGPAHIPFHLGDTAGGLYGAIAILAAVVELNRSGRGRALEIGLLDAQSALLGDEVTNCAASGVVPAQHGAGHPQLMPYRSFVAADAPLVIAAVGVEKFWINPTAALERPDLAADPRFADNTRRVANRALLESTLEEVLRGKSRDHWLARLAAADVPSAPVLDVRDALATRKCAIAKRSPKHGSPPALKRTTRTPIREAGAPPHAVLAAPPRGAHTRAVLAQRIGLDAHSIDRHIQAGVIR